MATKIYLKGGAINIEGATINTLIINPVHFDFSTKISNYFARDGIENQSYDLGNAANITDENGIAIGNDAAVVQFLSGLVNKQVGVNPSNVPASYTMQASNSIVKTINKGQLNKLRSRPQIINEQVESSRTIQGVVDATTIVGQVFKQSQDNINGILLTLESAEGIVFENYESYADSAALQLVWIKGGVQEATLETTINPPGSTKCMRIPLDDLADDWVDTVVAVDYTGYVGSLDFRQDTPFGITGAIVSLFLGDGTNTKSFELSFDTINEWHNINIPEQSMTEDQAGITDITAITKIGYRIVGKKNGAFAYIDNSVATPPPGKIGLKLWDMGANIPVTAVDSISSGTQYVELGDRGLNGGTVAAEIEVPLVGGKRLYSIKNFAAGVALEIPSNTILIPGNYYILTLNHIDTDVSVYGADPTYSTQYYNNGYAFTAPDEATPITAIGTYNDIMFAIFSTQDAFLNTLIKSYDAAPGNLARESIFIEDKNMKITGIIENDTLGRQELTAEFKDRVFPVPKGAKFEVYYNDDYTDGVTNASILTGYLYEPPIING